jgi:hypothetical protein
MKRTFRLLLVLGFATALLTGAFAVLAPPVEAGACICPQVYAPVVCDNGKVYANPCLAECRHAKNCVPTGDL